MDREDRLPRVLQLTLHWGESVLWTRTFELPGEIAVAEVAARLLGDRQRCWIEQDGHARRLELGRTRLERGAFTLLVDAVEDESVPAGPLLARPEQAVSDLSSLLIHGAIGLGLFLLADPLGPAKSPLEAELLEQRSVEAHELVFTVTSSDDSSGRGQVEASGIGTNQGAALRSRAPGVPPSSAQRPQRWGASQLAPEMGAVATAPESDGFGMIGLLASRPRDEPSDPWASSTESTGAPWLGQGEGWLGGPGGLDLSSIGEGGSTRSEGIGLANIGTCGEACRGWQGSGKHRRAGNAVGVRVGAVSICGQSFPPAGPKGPAPSDRFESISRCSSGNIGRLPPEVVQRVIRQNFGHFRMCYENNLRSQPALTGRVTARFTIARNGSVKGASASVESLPTAMASCVSNAISRLSFPEPEGGVVHVLYPIVFTPSD